MDGRPGALRRVLRAGQLLALALACSTCSFQPPGSCTITADCTSGLTCDTGVCVSCPGGICASTKVVPADGAIIQVHTTPYSSDGTLQLRFPARAVPAGSIVTMTNRPCGAIALIAEAKTCIGAFDLTAVGVTDFARPVRLSGSNLTDLLPGNLMVVARIDDSGTWHDVVLAVVDAQRAFHTLKVSPKLPGIIKTGTYVVYRAASNSPQSRYVADFGLALIPDDGNSGSHGLQIVSLYDDDGVPMPTPDKRLLPIFGADLDGAALTPDGSQGVIVDGANFVVFFSGVSTGLPTLSSVRLDTGAFGGDGDAIVISPDGDEVIVSADGPALVVITGITSGAPALAASIPLLANEALDGLVLSADGRVLLARGGPKIAVFNIDPIAPKPGPLGGTISHTYTRVADLAVSYPYGEDGRDGMALSPIDSSRGVVIGSNNRIQLITGLGSLTPRVGLPVSIGATIKQAASAAITPDGTRAIVGTEQGLVLFAGVDSGVLLQVGPPFNPPIPGGSTLGARGIPTLGITLDGLYVVALTPGQAFGTGTLLMMPLVAGGFGDPVSTLTGLGVPGNDQLLIH